MTVKIPVSILGATGTVGQKFVRLLAEHPWFEVAAVAASSASAGKRYGDAVRWRETVALPERIAALTVQECSPPLAGPIVFSALDAEVAGPVEQGFARAGAYVVTNARTHRMDAGRSAAHPGGQRRSPAPGGRPALGPRLARRDHHQSQLFHRGARHGARSPAPRLRRREAVRLHHAGGVGRRLSGRPLARHPRQRDPLHRGRGGEDRAREPQDPRRAGRRGRDTRRVRGKRAYQPGRRDRRPHGSGVGRLLAPGERGGGARGAAPDFRRRRASRACRQRPGGRSRWTRAPIARSRASTSSAAAA